MKIEIMIYLLSDIANKYGDIDVSVMVNGSVVASPSIVYKDSDCGDCVIECND